MPALPKHWSLESLLDYVWGVEAGLLALEETASLAPKWTRLAEGIKKERDARDEARQATARASARVRVLDARFDSQVGLLSGTAFLAAGKDPKTEPYHSLFGSVPAEEAKKLGPGKATTFGQDLVVTAKKLANAALTPLLAPFSKLLDQLAKAADDRRTASRDAKLRDLDREKLIEDAEELAAETEVGLLKTFLGQPDQKALVRAIVGVPRANPAPADQPSSDAPATPAA